ncbi:MAG: hypothetical protein Q8N17_26150 [Burkholderiaceae bacterium]|nr:hypothetical protein [Burkholderiaceae bacterium]
MSDFSNAKALIDYADRKSQRHPSTPLRACQCGKTLRFAAAEWNCGPACVLPITREPLPEPAAVTSVLSRTPLSR